MKTILAIVAMVLLSGAAWGQTKLYPEPVSQLQESWDNCVKRFKNIVQSSGTSSTVTFDSYDVLEWCRDNPPRNKIRADDPTAWKQTEADIILMCHDICTTKYIKTGVTEGYLFCFEQCVKDNKASRKIK